MFFKSCLNLSGGHGGIPRAGEEKMTVMRDIYKRKAFVLFILTPELSIRTSTLVFHGFQSGDSNLGPLGAVVKGSDGETNTLTGHIQECYRAGLPSCR